MTSSFVLANQHVEPRETPEEASRRLRAILGGYISTQIVAAAVRLGVLDQLSAECLALEQLSAASQVPAAELRRLLRALEGLRLVSRNADHYQLEPAGRLLTRSQGLLFGHALLSGTDYYEAWADLPEALASGESAFERRFGCNLWQRFSERPEIAAGFTKMMRQNTALVGARLLEMYELPPGALVVDLGAGDGSLLAELLASDATLRGIAVEQASVSDHTRATLLERGLGARSQVVSANLLEWVPDGADVYVLKSVLHNWRDEDARRILQRCRAAMHGDARLLVIERARDENALESCDLLDDAVQDLTMLVLFGSSDRSAEEYRQLLLQSGFGMVSTRTFPPGLTLIEALPAPC